MDGRTDDQLDAVVIGSGPNGLVAAALLARAGWRVRVLERNAVAGGAVQSAELTVPGYVHDTYSAFYGLLHASPVFAELGLDRRLEWAQFDVPVAAAVSPGDAALCYADPARTGQGLSKAVAGDGDAWRELFGWWQRTGRSFLDLMLAPIGSPTRALALARRLRRDGLIDGVLELARMQLQPMTALASDRFVGDAARALLAAGSSHADVAVDQAGSVPAALILAMAAQDVGMPVPVGGAGNLAGALVSLVEEAGGQVSPGSEVVRVITERGRAVGVETKAGAHIRARRAVLAAARERCSSAS